MALEEEVPEQAEDKTIPKYRQIDKRAGQHVLDWGKELETQYELWQQTHGGHKSLPAVGGKRAADTSAGGASKKVKTEGGALSEEEMRTQFEDDTIAKLTIPDLKAWCGSKKLAISGKKVDLVERIQSYFETK